VVIHTSSFVAAETEGCFLFVHSEKPPTDTDWEQVLSLYRNAPDRVATRSLICTLGGAPSAKQRAALNALLADSKPLMAVLTRSTLARAAGVAISWFNPRFKIFDLDDLSGALTHLGISARQREQVVRTLDTLRAELTHAGRKLG
jgi:hypothetical protein